MKSKVAVEIKGKKSKFYLLLKRKQGMSTLGFTVASSWATP
jgi:hypothetical protein